MSKITFRADDDLIEGIERFDASKSEIMRRALRAYLDTHDSTSPQSSSSSSLDELIADRVEDLVADAIDQQLSEQALTVNLALDGGVRHTAASSPDRKTQSPVSQSTNDSPRTCTQCGTTVEPDHVYCPNCGEKVSQRSFCECGQELQPDWAFCPSCGRRTPAADVLDSSDQQ